MGITHAWSTMKEKKKIKSTKGEWRKRETKDLPILQGRHKSGGLMYKTNGVEPDPRVN